MSLKFNSSHTNYLTFKMLYGIVTSDEFLKKLSLKNIINYYQTKFINTYFPRFNFFLLSRSHFL